MTGGYRALPPHLRQSYPGSPRNVRDVVCPFRHFEWTKMILTADGLDFLPISPLLDVKIYLFNNTVSYLQNFEFIFAVGFSFINFKCHNIDFSENGVRVSIPTTFTGLSLKYPEAVSHVEDYSIFFPDIS